MTQTVAATIFSQLGGNRFLAMTGAKNLLRGDDCLSMKLPGGGGKMRGLRVKLEANDSYTVWFYEMRKYQIVGENTVEGVYFENLRQVFTKLTGLDTHLA